MGMYMCGCMGQGVCGGVGAGVGVGVSVSVLLSSE